MKMTCKEVSVLLSQSQDRELTAMEQVRLQAHLAICVACKNFQRQLDILRQAIRRHPIKKEEERDRDQDRSS